jgi:putative Mg2+ transporter-C (MgtC) family protein
MANRLTGHEGAVHVVAYVVSGIGFLGAGVIMREEGNVRGLNTAATLWGSAAVGACAGADLLLEAVLGAVFVLTANTVLRPLVDRINRQPLDTLAVEVTNTVYVIAQRGQQKEALRLLEAALEAAGYGTRDRVVHAFGDDAVEIEAVLLATAVDGEHLDRLIRQLAEQPCISQAFWSPSTTE